MIYSQALVALLFDGIIWDQIPGVISLVGCLLISVALAVATLLGSQNDHNEVGDTGNKLDVEMLPVEDETLR